MYLSYRVVVQIKWDMKFHERCSQVPGTIREAGVWFCRCLFSKQKSCIQKIPEDPRKNLQEREVFLVYVSFKDTLCNSLSIFQNVAAGYIWHNPMAVKEAHENTKISHFLPRGEEHLHHGSSTQNHLQSAGEGSRSVELSFSEFLHIAGHQPSCLPAFTRTQQKEGQMEG